ncbi:peptidylprolyl isomerase [Algicella marina]|uniref:peptidylprolyl isomerase n=1 Tax=Algicella marina TaxID=2683284 RepID=UPI00137B2A40|nr:peptidylprolyl isomerase [Algicella marina]
MKRLLVASLLIALTPFAQPARAQESGTPYAPVVVVNESVITGYELEQRARMLEVFGAGGDVLALAEEQLISDRLQLQAAETLGLEIDDETVESAAEEFAGRRELTAEVLRNALQARGVAPETFNAFIRAGITWRSVVQSRFRRQATPTENDLDAALALADRGLQKSVLLQEIGMPFAENGEEETMDTAWRLSRELNRGGNFTGAVRRYSKTPSRARDGKLGWLPETALPPQVAAQILALQVGEVTAPIPITRGVSILKLLDVREEARESTSDGPLTVTYSELIIPLSQNAADGAVNAARNQAERIRSDTELCRDLDQRADEFGIGSGRSEPTPVGAVPQSISLLLSQMDPGDIEIQEDSRGVVLVMLCARSNETSPEEREALRQRLFNQRMNTLGQGYLQDLRGDAVIERRS